jgi:hypothetical protein
MSRINWLQLIGLYICSFAFLAIWDWLEGKSIRDINLVARLIACLLGTIVVGLVVFVWLGGL